MAVSQFVDNFACLLGAAYNTGSGSVTLQTGYGATLASRLTQIGSAGISVDSPLRFTLIEQSANGVISPTTKFAIYLATSLSGDVLSGVTVAEGTTDQQFAINDVFAVLWTAGGQKELADIARTSPTDASVVHKTGDETIAGTKTFSTTIVGSISGNAATVTNGVYTSGSYANPSWIASLAGSKISGDITGNSANVSGTIAIANGGTGQTTAATAINALAPSQTGNSGKYLTTNGTAVSWGTVSVSPAGSTGQLQYNNAGAFAGAAWSTVATSGNLLNITAPTRTDVPLTITPTIGTATITNVAIASKIATITTSAAHDFVAGRLVTIAGATPSALNGRWNILSVPTSTTLTVLTSAGDSASASSGGTANSTTQTGYPLALMDSGSLTGVRVRPYCSAATTSTGALSDYHFETVCDTPNVSGTTIYRGWMSYQLSNTGNQDAARIALKANSALACAIDFGIYGGGGVIDFWAGGDHGGNAASQALTIARNTITVRKSLVFTATTQVLQIGSSNAFDSTAQVCIASTSGQKALVLQRNGSAGTDSLLSLQNTDQGSSNIFGRIDGSYRWQIGSGTMSGAMLGVLADAAATPVLNVCGTASQTGALVTLAGQSSTTARQPMAYIDAAWSDATHASRLADVVISTTGYNGLHESIRFRDTGAISQVVIPIANVRDAADDAAAAALSPAVPVGGIYRTGSALKIRVS